MSRRRGIPRYLPSGRRLAPRALRRLAPTAAPAPAVLSAPERSHAHAEAFRLMTYESADGRERLLIWNSRDGVTPFGCSHPVTGTPLTHVRWSQDSYLPDHVPDVGDWIWVDLHDERALMKARAFVDRWWADPEIPMHEHPHFNPTGAPPNDETAKREAALIYAQSLTVRTGEPDLTQVTEQMRSDLLGRAR